MTPSDDCPSPWRKSYPGKPSPESNRASRGEIYKEDK